MTTNEILLRKVIYSDKSINYYMVIKQAAMLNEIKLKKYQYEQMKGTGLFTNTETDFSKTSHPVS